MADPVLNGKYIIELDELTSIELDAWLAFQPDEVSDEAFRISLENFIAALPVIPAVAAEYDTIADLLTAQPGQTIDVLYHVLNPIADPAFNDLPDAEVKSVYYHLPGAKNGLLSDYNSIAFPKLGSDKNSKLGNSLDAFTFDIKFRTAEWSSNQATLQAAANALDLNSPQDLKLTGEAVKLITGNDPTDISRVLFGLDGQLIFEPIPASKIQSDSSAADVTLNDSYQEILSITGGESISSALANIGLTAKSFATGAITVFADAGDGRITVTSATHGLSEGDFIEIVNTTNYGGIYEIKAVPNINDFDITKAFVSTETGDWEISANREIAIDLRVNEISVKEFTRQIEGEGRLNFSEPITGLVNTEDIDVFAKSNTSGEAIEILGTSQSSELKVINLDADREVSTWYVNDASGSDANDGSPQKPFETIAPAIAAASSGDTIILGDGFYSDDFTIDKSIYFFGFNKYEGFSFGASIDPTNLTIAEGVDVGFTRVGLEPTNIIQSGAGNIDLHVSDTTIGINSMSGVTLKRFTISDCTGTLPALSFATAARFFISDGSLTIASVTMAGSGLYSIRGPRVIVSGNVTATSAVIFVYENCYFEVGGDFDNGTNAATVYNSVINVVGTYTHGTLTVNNQADGGLQKQAIGPTLAIPFNVSQTKIDPLTITGVTEFTVDTTNAEYGNMGFRRITADGTNEPTFAAPFQKWLASRDYDNTNGTVNILSWWFDDISYYYAWGQGEATAPPTILSMDVEDASRNDLVVVFSEVVTATNIGYTFRVDAGSRTLDSVSGSGTDTLTFVISGAAIDDADVLDLAYDSGTGDTLNAGLTELVTFTATSVTNNTDTTVPTLTSATIENATDDILDLVFDEAVNITITGWNIDTDGAALSISSVSSGDGTSIPKFQLSRSVLSTETLNLDYDSGVGDTTDTATIPNDLASITDEAVTNNVSAVSELTTFNGTSNYFTLGTQMHSIMLGADKKFAMEITVKDYPVDHNGALFTIAGDNVQVAHFIAYNVGAEEWRYIYWDGTTSNWTVVKVDQILPQGTEYILRIEYDGSVDTAPVDRLVFKIDDTPQTVTHVNTVGSFPFDVPSVTSKLALGIKLEGDDSTSGVWLDAKLKDFKVYSGASLDVLEVHIPTLSTGIDISGEGRDGTFV